MGDIILRPDMRHRSHQLELRAREDVRLLHDVESPDHRHRAGELSVLPQWLFVVVTLVGTQHVQLRLKADAAGARSMCAAASCASGSKLRRTCSGRRTVLADGATKQHCLLCFLPVRTVAVGVTSCSNSAIICAGLGHTESLAGVPAAMHSFAVAHADQGSCDVS